MKVIIAGGGTGGHLFPGIAIAEEFMKRDRSSQVIFVGTKNGIEKDVLPGEGFTLETIMIEGVKGKNILKKIFALLKMPLGIIQSLFILVEYRPDIVIGVGGYASFPAVLSSSLLGIPNIIHEQNRIPGLANKILARIAKKVAVTFKESLNYFSKDKTEITGNPVRKRLINGFKKEVEDDDRFTIFVFGGSQGASSINLSMIESLEFISKLKEVHIIHQTGGQDFDMVKEGYEKNGVSADVYPFIKDMAECYARSNLVICRSGATAIAELTACGKPSILIPYPFAANNHQEINARVLEEKGAAEVLLDRDVNGKSLADRILAFINDKEKTREMAKKSSRLSRVDAAEKIVDICYELI